MQYIFENMNLTIFYYYLNKQYPTEFIVEQLFLKTSRTSRSISPTVLSHVI